LEVQPEGLVLEVLVLEVLVLEVLVVEPWEVVSVVVTHHIMA